MTNGKMDSGQSGFGDFQANVGRVGATFNYVWAWLFLIVFTVFGIIGIVQGINGTHCACEDIACLDGSPCGACTKGTCDQKVTRRSYIGYGILCIAIGIIVLVFSRWWMKAVYKDKGVAEFGGAMTEMDMIGNMFNRN